MQELARLYTTYPEAVDRTPEPVKKPSDEWLLAEDSLLRDHTPWYQHMYLALQ